MKTFRRIVRRKLEADKRAARPRDATPVMNDPRPETPCEVIDLGTGPFQAAYPELARRIAARTSAPVIVVQTSEPLDKPRS